MRAVSTVTVLSLLVAVLVAVAALCGLVSSFTGPAPAVVSTIRGGETTLYGHGLYAYDSLLIGAGFVAQDVVALLIGIPLLIAGVVLRKRTVGLAISYSGLAFLLYAYASMALGAAYNPAFLLYVAIVSASLFGSILAHRELEAHLHGVPPTPGVPRRAIAIFLLAAGLVTAVIWLMPIVETLLAGKVLPHLDGYTTIVTDVFDLAVIVPLCLLSAAWIWGGQTRGLVLAVPLLGLIVALLPLISLSTFLQWRAGVPFTLPEIIGPVAGFLVLGAIAAWLGWRLLHAWGTHAGR